MHTITVLSLLVVIQLASSQFQFGLNFPNVFNPQASNNNNNPGFNWFGNPYQQQPNYQNQYGNNPFLNQNQNQRPPKPPPPPPPPRPPTTNTNTQNRPSNPVRPVIVSNSNFNDRISQVKCREYTNEIGKQQLFGSLSLDSTVLQVNLQKCDSSIGLVVGGEDAKAGEFPHMVAIGYPQGLSGQVGFNCGGTLISERFVLTAAHCRKAGRVKPTIVRVGELNLAEHDEGLPELDIPIAEFIVHEEYDAQQHKNDIALIKLKNNVKFTEDVHPACLAQPNLVVKRKAIASGWGFTEVAGQTADHLQKVDLSIINNDQCSRLLQRLFSSSNDYLVDDGQMCAGELTGGKDTCQGDSGGPLTIPSQKNQCMYILLGVTSYGTPFCGEANSPGVYTRVSSYLDWIEPRVWGA